MLVNHKYELKHDIWNELCTHMEMIFLCTHTYLTTPKEMINDVVGIHVRNFMSVQVITTFDVVCFLTIDSTLLSLQ